MRSRDRLEEFRRRARIDAADGECAVPLATADEHRGDKRNDIDDVFHEVERVRGWIQEVRDNTQMMRRLLADETYHNNRHLQEQLEGAAARSGGAGLKVAGALRQIDATAARLTGAAKRIAQLQSATLRRHFADALDQQHATLDALREQQRRMMQQQLKLVNFAATDEECQRLLETDNIALFVDNIHADTAEAKRALRDAESRRDELLRVERAIQEVNDLFREVATHVAAQQQQIDTVEMFASRAEQHVDEGQQQLLKGTVSRKKAQKKKWGLLVCVAAGGIVVLLVLIFT